MLPNTHRPEGYIKQWALFTMHWCGSIAGGGITTQHISQLHSPSPVSMNDWARALSGHRLLCNGRHQREPYNDGWHSATQCNTVQHSATQCNIVQHAHFRICGILVVTVLQSWEGPLSKEASVLGVEVSEALDSVRDQEALSTSTQEFTPNWRPLRQEFTCTYIYRWLPSSLS